MQLLLALRHSLGPNHCLYVMSDKTLVRDKRDQIALTGATERLRLRQIRDRWRRSLLGGGSGPTMRRGPEREQLFVWRGKSKPTCDHVNVQARANSLRVMGTRHL